MLKRIDRFGSDVTLLPGLWDESDQFHLPRLDPMDIIKPLVRKGVNAPNLPYQPVLKHFGVAPILHWDASINYDAWTIYHYKGARFPRYWLSKPEAVEALWKLQQSAEFQRLRQLVEQYPEDKTFWTFDWKGLLEDIESMGGL